MTIDDLRAKKRELLDRKRELSQAGADPFELAILDEEILDVTAQMRAMAPTGKKQGFGRGGRVVSDHSEYRISPSDRQQFASWLRQDEDELADTERVKLHRLLRYSMGFASDKQRAALLLISDGMSQTEVARELGVSKSTISRTVNLGKANVARMLETQLAIDKLRNDKRLDLARPEAAKLLVSSLTPHQAVCFYLHYAEGMTFREAGELLGIDYSSVCRTTQRAVLRINAILGENVKVLEHVEKMDDVAYAVYCALREQSDKLPPVVCRHINRPAGGKHLLYGEDLIQENEGSVGAYAQFRVESRLSISRLLCALRERYAQVVSQPGAPKWSHPVARWLNWIFKSIAGRS